MKRSVAVVSGYFNPLHVGHVRMMREARALADMLIVIVNNDEQQILKKGRVIIRESDRAEVVENIRVVDKVLLATDRDGSVRDTLAEVRRLFPGDRIIFANGGDRRDAASIAEADVCAELGIEIVFGVGGSDKADASSRIIAETGV
ncbi:adenylyltransferase/cytidyltransferase family protein [Longispora albida]|uniref:adenylyltransferase/cytidyltransferase family protein n=1 Tax=Longispora albida TaxID=203523 RepID=UPI00058E8488|nr:adenylyltransferase/cytidyltransferase family protein [Longispora albida]